LLAFNKSDIADEAVITGLRAEYPPPQFVSAAAHAGSDEPIEASAARPPAPDTDITLPIPYARGDLVSKIYALGTVEHEERSSEGTSLQAKVPAELVDELREFQRPDLVIDQ